LNLDHLPTKSNQLNFLNSLSSFARTFIIVTVAFLLYGYLCRPLGIYFFWESKTIGWTLFWITIALVLRNRIKSKKLQKKSAIPEKIGIGLSVFVVLLKGILFFAIQQTSAYDKALIFINEDKGIQNEVGAVKGVFFVPFGGMSMSSGPQGTTGQADLNFVVKGSKKYIDLNLLMAKELEGDWRIGIQK